MVPAGTRYTVAPAGAEFTVVPAEALGYTGGLKPETQQTVVSAGGQ